MSSGIITFAARLLCLLSIASSAYGMPVSVINNGPSANRVDIVFLGDGYTSTDISNGTYARAVQSYTDFMFGPGINQDPFYRYRNFFNVYRIDVESKQSGADVPPQSTYRDTALNASYYYDSVTERLLYVSEAKANAMLASHLTGTGIAAEMKFIAVNDTRYGGGGGNYAVFAAGNAASKEIALHEMAHAFSGLADEYGGSAGRYPGAEPSEPNVTKNATGQKWSRWLGYNQPGIGVIGAYQGARYYNTGIYRPSLNSKMRTLGQPFDAVAREKIILDIYALVDPLDAWLDNTTTLIDPDILWVELVDSDILDIEWLVNGIRVPGAAGEVFNLLDFGFSPGTYTVTGHAFDPTAFDPVGGWVRTNSSRLEESITWTVELIPEPTGISLIVLGLMLGLPTAGRSIRRGRKIRNLEPGLRGA